MGVSRRIRLDMNVRFVVFDPGITTGWAIMEGDPKAELLPRVVESGEVRGLLRTVLVAIRAVKKSDCSELILEQFLPTRVPSTMAMVETCEVIGALKLAAAFVRVNVTIQSPAVRRPFLGAAKEIQASSKHATDAIAHGMRYYADRRKRSGRR
jgi:hypothetical protein